MTEETVVTTTPNGMPYYLRLCLFLAELTAIAFLGEASLMLGAQELGRWRGMMLRLGFAAVVIAFVCALALLLDARRGRWLVVPTVTVVVSGATALAVTPWGCSDDDVDCMMRYVMTGAGLTAGLCMLVELVGYLVYPVSAAPRRS